MGGEFVDELKRSHICYEVNCKARGHFVRKKGRSSIVSATEKTKKGRTSKCLWNERLHLRQRADSQGGWIMKER